MFTPIPEKLNGYNIIAFAPVYNLSSKKPDNDVRVILGHDPSRRYPAYVTALVSNSSIEGREWFWGHYFDGTEDCLRGAMEDFMVRTNIKSKDKEPADA